MALAALALSAQAPPAQTPPKKDWVDRGEYELVAEQIGKTTDPAKKLELLNQWKQKYPNTQFGWERLGQYLVTYQQLGKAKEMMDIAKQMTTADSANFTGPYYVVLLVQSMQATDPVTLDEGEKAANALLTNLNDFFAATKKPEGVADDAWQKQKDEAQLKALQTLVYISTVKKDWPAVEKRITDLLKVQPNNAIASYQLGVAILSQRQPERQVQAIWHFARACGLDGAGAYAAPEKAKVCDYFNRVYPQYRGDRKGLDELKARAVAQAFPPTDFAIKTKQQEDMEGLEELKKTNPQLAIWVQMKQALTAKDGNAYWETMKDKALPKFKGKIVSMEPAVNPKKLVVGISDASNPEVTIEMAEKEFLPGKMEPGEEIEFEGVVAKEFTPDPFMITVTADKDQITGWTGKAAAPARKTTPRSKKK